MSNTTETFGQNPVPKNYFLLRVDAVFDIPCRKVTGLSRKKEYETIQAGGVNDYVFLRPKPVSNPTTFKIERYIGTDFFDPLPLGKQPLLPLVLYVSRYPRKFESAEQIFLFKGCTVLAKDYGELDAEHSGLMVETTEIAYQQVEIVINSKEEKQT